MLLRQDSIEHEDISAVETPVEPRQTKPQHPYQVLRQLPKDATPAQQDSAIQATFQPKEVTYSSRPDTLHLPGRDAGKSIKDVSLPQYYKESFFSTDSLFHPELNGGRYGVAGSPMPYTLRNDNIISLLFIFCFVIGMVAFARSRRFILRQTKHFFYVPRSENSTITETTSEVRFQFFLVLQTALLLSLLQYFYTQHFIGNTFILSSEYQLIAIYFGMWTGYFLVKGLLYSVVNTVFFGARKNLQWLKSFLFITAMEGVLLLPFGLLLVYFNMAIESVITYFLAVLIFVKLLTFYKCYIIFFRRTAVILQIILYFCALEIIPLTAMWGVLVMMGNYLKINY